ncbi:MAG: hypothetical protein M3Q23_07370 [Actinomycetota bacterium]|nr:hypothetical protein [Actinomycetota bacterium]
MRRGTGVLLAAVLLAACTGGQGPPPPGHRPSVSPSPVASGSTSGGPHPASCQAAPPYANPAQGRPRYTLGVRLDLARGHVIGKESVTFTPDLPTGRLVFRLWPNAPPQAAEGAHLAVGRVQSGDTPLASRLTDPTTLEVTPPAPLAGGQSITVSMAFTLKLPGAVLDRLSHDGSTVLLGSFFPVLPWVDGQGWALDPPTTTLAEASTDPTADFDVTIRLPKGLELPHGIEILATGERDGPSHWTATAVRDFAIAVGSFKTATNVLYAPDPITVTVGIERTVAAPPPAQLLERIDETLGSLANHYGPYPWKSFSLVLVNVLERSGIEYPNLVFEGARGIDRVTTHEMAHQWFYSLVGNDQALDPWLDEALATWAAAQIDGYLPFIQQQPIHGVAENHVGSPMAFWDHHSRAYELGVYFRGVQALASLGSPDLIDCALRTYVAQRAYQVAVPGDLLDALDAVIPDATAKLASFGIHP